MRKVDLQTVYMAVSKTDDRICVLCLCWCLVGLFNSHVIKRVNYVVEHGTVNRRRLVGLASDVTEYVIVHFLPNHVTNIVHGR